MGFSKPRPLGRGNENFPLAEASSTVRGHERSTAFGNPMLATLRWHQSSFMSLVLVVANRTSDGATPIAKTRKIRSPTRKTRERTSHE
jgi:hypothetical protein